MEQIERSRYGWIGLDEFPRETLRPVPDAQDVEAAPHRPRRPPRQPREIGGQEGQHRHGFIELDGVAGDSISQIDAPGQGGRRPVGPVREPLEQAAQPPDRNSDGERPGEQAAGRLAYPAGQFVELHPDHRAGEGADDAVRQGRGRGHQGIQRAGQPCAERRAARQTGRIARTHGPRGPIGQAAEPPAVQQKAEAGAYGPAQQVEQQMNAGQGRNDDHPRNRPCRPPRRNHDRPCRRR